MHKLFSLFNQVELTISNKCKLFDALVGSILNYGAEVWGYHEATYVEILHTKVLPMGIKCSKIDEFVRTIRRIRAVSANYF